MTTRLYYTDAYTTEFTATVVSVDGGRVVLDRTAFYPTSGGQPFDVGVIGGATVTDVIDDDHRIVHVVRGGDDLHAGATTSARVDWTRRFDHMQQHTGQHLLSAVFEELFGHKTVSVHFGDDSATLDLDVEMLADQRVLKAEARANALVFENRLVTVSFEDAATATGLRKASDRSGEIRIVSIDGIDRSACGGTHVRTTGEIGPITIRRVEKSKKNVRVEFLCGFRALRRARTDFMALSALSAAMTTSIDELPALVASQSEKLHAAESARRKLAEEVARYQCRELYDAAQPAADGMRRIVRACDSLDEARSLAQAAGSFASVLFVGTVASPPTIVAAASEDSRINTGAILKNALNANGGRGGGSPRLAQGTVPDSAALAATVAALTAATPG
jgi:alanyl-tRNA synthetase